MTTLYRGEKLRENILDKASIIIFRNTMLDVFQWEEGNYRFEDLDVNTENMLACNLPTEGVVLDTLRIIDEYPLIKPKTPPFGLLPCSHIAPYAGISRKT